jgi:hypothetical protein
MALLGKTGGTPGGYTVGKTGVQMKEKKVPGVENSDTHGRRG